MQAHKYVQRKYKYCEIAQNPKFAIELKKNIPLLSLDVEISEKTFAAHGQLCIDGVQIKSYIKLSANSRHNTRPPVGAGAVRR